MRVQLVGPMQSLQDWNYPAFRDAAKELRQRGYEVFSPAESFGGDTTLPRSSYMRASIGALLNTDAVALLPGWESSPGAKTEMRVALALGIPVAPLERYTGEPPLELDPFTEYALAGGPDD